MTSIHRQILLFLALGILLRCAPSFGWVEISGEIGSDTTWTAADTIQVVGNLVVLTGATLTVEPGAVVLCDHPAVIQVYGSLQAVGEEDAPIIFSSVSDTTASEITVTYWGGLEFRRSAASLMRYCTFRYAVYPIYVSNSALSLQYCTIEDFQICGVNVHADAAFADATTTIDCCTISQVREDLVGKGTGVFVEKAGRAEVLRSWLLDCGYGLRVYGCLGCRPQFEVDNCQIEGNQDGGIMVFTGG